MASQITSGRLVVYNSGRDRGLNVRSTIQATRRCAHPHSGLQCKKLCSPNTASSTAPVNASTMPATTLNVRCAHPHTVCPTRAVLRSSPRTRTHDAPQPGQLRLGFRSYCLFLSCAHPTQQSGTPPAQVAHCAHPTQQETACSPTQQ